MKEHKDNQLWQQAKKRAEFKSHFSLYIVVISAFWATWFFGQGMHTHPWPVYPSLGWGIGIIANYYSAYKFDDTAEKEYKKLERKLKKPEAEHQDENFY